MPVLSRPMQLLTFVGGLSLTAVAIRYFGRGVARHARTVGLHGRDARDAEDDESSSAQQGAGSYAPGSRRTRRRGLAGIARIVKICCPNGIASIEGFWAVLSAVLMLVRTQADLLSINKQTEIELAIIQKRVRSFESLLVEVALIAIPVSAANAMMRYALKQLEHRLQLNLTAHLVRRCTEEKVLYRLTRVDDRLREGPQHTISEDAAEFARVLVELYRRVVSSLTNIAIYCYRLGQSIGVGAPAALSGFLLACGAALNWLRRPGSDVMAERKRLQGELQHVVSRLSSAAEEVSFYRGEGAERGTLLGALSRLVGLQQLGSGFEQLVHFLETMLTKRVAAMVGFVAMARAFFHYWPGMTQGEASAGGPGAARRGGGTAEGKAVQEYYRSGRLMVNTAESVGRLVLATRELSKLGAMEGRIARLLDVVADLQQGHYERPMVGEARDQGGKGEGKGSGAAAAQAGAGGETVQRIPFVRGTVQEADGIIKFDKVPVVTPNGDVLVRSLSFEVRQGQNTMLVGPNGCGKSSLFRILAGLWPLAGGSVTRPRASKLFYIPQKPYLSIGTLREQVVYPDKADAGGSQDAAIMALLEQVQLGAMVQQKGGLGAVRNWDSECSGGQKQRLAIARLLHHRPAFAVLDECTASVSQDVEDALYQTAASMGMSLFTISHSKEVWKHHSHVLRFDGRGGYQFRELSDRERAGGGGAFGDEDGEAASVGASDGEQEEGVE